MQIDVDVTGRKVVVIGTRAGTRRVLERFRQAEARVTLVLPHPVPPVEERAPGVRYAAQPEPADASGLLRLLGPAWMVVLVDASAELAARAVELATHLRVLVQRERPAAPSGQVILVGGGPGSTRLLTLEALEALGAADVVFYDRLGPTEDLPRLAPGAEVVDVGKSPYHHKVTQGSIEAMLVQRARSGLTVVRLKGGDPFVFGRGGEEMLACLAAGVPVRVVPGVSSSLAIPAASGIPVTHRGLSRAFTVISGHVPPSADELAALVRLGGTIVVLMGMSSLEQIVAGLTAAGMVLSTPAAVVERGFSASQRSTFTTVGAVAAEVRRLDLGSPAVVVVGAVVGVAPGADRTGELRRALARPAERDGSVDQVPRR